MATKDKPKIKGLSFNLFAIIALLVILPVSTAFVSNLADNSSSEYVSVNEMVDMFDPSICNAPLNEMDMVRWVNKGVNMTDAYMERDNNPNVNDYDTLWDESLFYYDYNILGCLEQSEFRNGDEFFQARDNHYGLRLSMNNYGGYIGYSGDSFSFEITENYFKFLPDGQDIKKFKFTFIDHDNTWNCEQENLFQDLEYKSDITFFFDKMPSTAYKLADFKFDRTNRYEVDFLPLNQVPSYSNGTGQPYGNICHIQLVLEYELTNFEAIEFSERFSNNYDNVSALIEIYDIKASYSDDNLQTGGNVGGVNVIQMPLPFTGDYTHATLFEVSYVDTTNTNFILKGGTLVMGIGLFALAIANTPYWNPVINFFKEGS